MNKKVLIISSSLRANSNSHMLAQSFCDGAKEAGHETELISLRDKQISFCRGCLACQRTQKCVIDDDAVALAEKMKSSDVLVFATPIYYYEMSGQLKTLLDRANPLYTTDYKFRDIYLIATAAEDEDSTWERAASGLQGWIDCFPKARFARAIFGGGVTDPGEIRDRAVMEKARALGKGI